MKPNKLQKNGTKTYVAVAVHGDERLEREVDMQELLHSVIEGGAREELREDRHLHVQEHHP